MNDLFGLVEIVEDDGLCHYKMHCEHGESECLLLKDHEETHENIQACKELRLYG